MALTLLKPEIDHWKPGEHNVQRTSVRNYKHISTSALLTSSSIYAARAYTIGKGYAPLREKSCRIFGTL